MQEAFKQLSRKVTKIFVDKHIEASSDHSAIARDINADLLQHFEPDGAVGVDEVPTDEPTTPPARRSTRSSRL